MTRPLSERLDVAMLLALLAVVFWQCMAQAGDE